MVGAGHLTVCVGAVCIGDGRPGSIHLFNGRYDAKKSGALIAATCGQVSRRSLCEPGYLGLWAWTAQQGAVSSRCCPGPRCGVSMRVCGVTNNAGE